MGKRKNLPRSEIRSTTEDTEEEGRVSFLGRFSFFYDYYDNLAENNPPPLKTPCNSVSFVSFNKSSQNSVSAYSLSEIVVLAKKSFRLAEYLAEQNSAIKHYTQSNGSLGLKYT